MFGWHISGISIHSLPKEGDADELKEIAETTAFQSTPSPRRETTNNIAIIRRTKDFNPLPPQGGRHETLRKRYNETGISIHSLPKEGDG